jgi:hypothetical protein
MAYVPIRTDQTKYAEVDGTTADGTANQYGDFGTPVELAAGGFGIKRIDPRSGKEFFEYLDAFPAGKKAVQLAVEAGSAKVAATVGGAAAGFTAVNFATADNLSAGEIAADADDGLQAEDQGPGDLTV